MMRGEPQASAAGVRLGVKVVPACTRPSRTLERFQLLK